MLLAAKINAQDSESDATIGIWLHAFRSSTHSLVLSVSEINQQESMSNPAKRLFFPYGANPATSLIMGLTKKNRPSWAPGSFLKSPKKQ
jgi:hypothetical protein